MDFSTTGIPFKLIKRKNQKYLRIRVTREGEVVVSAPLYTPEREIERLLQTKERWIRRHLTRFSAEREKLDPLTQISLGKEKLNVEVIRDTTRKRLKISFLQDENICRIEGPASDRDSILKALKKALLKKAREELTARTEELSRETGIPINKLIIRDQRTRWGSSSGRGNISLNWRVVMLPPEHRDYLIIHELCHQMNFNHSSAFWDSVAAFCPESRKLDRELKEKLGIMSLFR